MSIEIRLLGPVEVLGPEKALDIGHAKQRAVFALLAADANRVVLTEQLEDRLWSGRPPTHARKTLHSYLTRLRHILREVPDIDLSRRESGYALSVDDSLIDLVRFRSLCEQARHASPPTAVELWRASLRLWRSDPFAGLDVAWLDSLRHGLEAERYDARLEYHAAMIATDRCGEVLPQVADLIESHPFDQRLAEQYMETLHRLGRPAEALRHYSQLWKRMVDALGQEPSAPLRKLQQRILAGEEATALPLPDPAATPVAVPRQLPAETSTFVGRAEETDEVVRILRAAQPAVCIVDGMAGVGKTTFAIHVANRVAADFADGQLFIDMGGFSDHAEPVEPVAALGTLLRALGVDVAALPADVAGRATLFRSILADKRMLLVIDNVAGEEQVLPLLPGSGDCPVLVTSRRRLAEVDDAHLVTLSEMTAVEAIALFDKASEREDSTLDTLSEVVEMCGYLPLAVRIAASRLRSRPSWSVAQLHTRLATERQRLRELRAGQRQVSAVFAVSLRDLSAQHHRVFRAFGMVPGPDTPAGAIAAITDLPVGEATVLLDDLVDANLVNDNGVDRYRAHDLVRLYARDVLMSEMEELARREAGKRLYDWYLAHAYAAARASRTLQYPKLTIPAIAGADFPGDASRAIVWLNTECDNLVALMRSTFDEVRAALGWELMEVTLPVLLERLYPAAMLELGEIGRRIAEEQGDAVGQTLILMSMSIVDYSRFALQRQNEMARRAVEAARATDDKVLHALTRGRLASSLALTGELGAAEQHIRDAIQIGRELQTARLPVDLNVLGNIRAVQGDLAGSIVHYQEALSIVRRDESRGPQVPLYNLGGVYMQLGDLPRAESYFQEALRQTRARGGERLGIAVLTARAESRLCCGDVHAAQEILRQAQDLSQRCRQGHDSYLQAMVTRCLLIEPQEAERVGRACWQTAAAARDVRTEARISPIVAEALLRLGRQREAVETAHRGVDRAGEYGYVVYEAVARITLARALWADAACEEARAHAVQALRAHRVTGFVAGEVEALLLLETFGGGQAQQYGADAARVTAATGVTGMYPPANGSPVRLSPSAVTSKMSREEGA